MDPCEMCRIFTDKLHKILDSHSKQDPIKVEDVKSVSKILKNFNNCCFASEEIKVFLKAIIKYFLLLIQYAKQFDNVISQLNMSNFVVRMSLNIFIFVIDNTKMYVPIFKRLVKIIIRVIESHNETSCIKEFLRVYVSLFQQVLNNYCYLLPQIANMCNKSVDVLCLLVQKTNDIELQAIIIDIFIRHLIMFNITEPFKKLLPDLNVSVLNNKVSTYEDIRMVLNMINGPLFKIFSINCTSITVDHVPVVEFDAANLNNDVWLDVNLFYNKFSFFVNQHFLKSFTTTKFCNATNWEVLSFFAEEALLVNFNYNSRDDNLEIEMKIKTCSLNLFSNMQFDTVKQLKIRVSKFSNKYEDFVTQVLPKVFSTSFTLEQPDIVEKGNVETSSTQSGFSNSPGPIIEHFEISNKTKKMSAMASQNVIEQTENIIISDDNDEEIVEITSPNEKNHSRQKLSTFDSRLDISTDGNKKKTSLKWSGWKRRNIFNKSITPISFSESLVNKSVKSTAENENQEINLASNKRRKISTIKEKLKMKISTSLTINMAQSTTPLLVNGVSELLNLEKINGRNDISDTDKINESNFATTKVQNWLKTIEQENNTERENGKIISEVDSKLSVQEFAEIHSLCSQVSKRSSIIENKLEKIFSESDKHSKKIQNDISIESSIKENKNNNPGTTYTSENLLDILLTPVHDDVITPEKKDDISSHGTPLDNENRKKDRHRLHSLSRLSSANSDIPLMQLSAKLAKNKKPDLSPENLLDILLTPVHDRVTTAEKKDDLISHSTPFDDVNREKDYNLSHSVSRLSSDNSDISLIQLLEKSQKNKKLDLSIEIQTDRANPLNEKSSTRISEDVQFQETIEQKNEHEIHTEVETSAEQKIINQSRNISNFNETDNNASKSMKRKLYNPEDLSYLKNTVTESYNKSNTDLCVYSGKESTEEKQNPFKKTKSTTRRNHKKTDLPKIKSKLNVTVNNNTSFKNLSNLKFSEVYDSFKSRIRENKKEIKKRQKSKVVRRVKKKKYLKEVPSPSSPSSFEPFGKSVLNDLEKDKLPSSFDNQSQNKRFKRDEPINGSQEMTPPVNKNINIISNIVVKSAQRNECWCTSYDEFTKNLIKCFMSFILHISNCNSTDIKLEKDILEVAKVLNVYLRK